MIIDDDNNSNSISLNFLIFQTVYNDLWSLEGGGGGGDVWGWFISYNVL